jgi:thymidylate synthase ThyX
MPRFILAELNTHRMFSRSTSSQRAIPIAKVLKWVEEDPATPVYWGANRAGMQAGEEVEDVESLKKAWKELAAETAKWVRARSHVHKQTISRPLYPFTYADTIITATDWDNFFKLRIHPDAQPEMQDLAIAIKEAMDALKPEEKKEHLPYITDKDRISKQGRDLMMISAARCARVSYCNHGNGNVDLEKDMQTALMLLSAGHLSPFEHQAAALKDGSLHSANFRGWFQFRSMLANENPHHRVSSPCLDFA